MAPYDLMVAELSKLNTQPDPDKIVFMGSSAYCTAQSEAGGHSYIWHDGRWVDVQMGSDDFVFSPLRAAQ